MRIFFLIFFLLQFSVSSLFSFGLLRRQTCSLCQATQHEICQQQTHDCVHCVKEQKDSCCAKEAINDPKLKIGHKCVQDILLQTFSQLAILFFVQTLRFPDHKNLEINPISEKSISAYPFVNTPPPKLA